MYDYYVLGPLGLGFKRQLFAFRFSTCQLQLTGIALLSPMQRFHTKVQATVI